MLASGVALCFVPLRWISVKEGHPTLSYYTAVASVQCAAEQAYSRKLRGWEDIKQIQPKMSACLYSRRLPEPVWRPQGAAYTKLSALFLPICCDLLLPSLCP